LGRERFWLIEPSSAATPSPHFTLGRIDSRSGNGKVQKLIAER
jgi:hypothetical protein